MAFNRHVQNFGIKKEQCCTFQHSCWVPIRAIHSAHVQKGYYIYVHRISRGYSPEIWIPRGWL